MNVEETLFEINERTVRIEERVNALPDRFTAQRAMCEKHIGQMENRLADVERNRKVRIAKVQAIGVVIAAAIGLLGAWAVKESNNGYSSNEVGVVGGPHDGGLQGRDR